MAEQIGAAPPPASFEYELFEGDPDRLRTVAATPNLAVSWIDPLSLKLKHRIGRGAFGDVWLATHHQSADDYDEYHEVAIKMLHRLKEDHMQTFFDRFENIFRKSRELQGVCWLHGITIKNGKVTLMNYIVCFNSGNYSLSIRCNYNLSPKLLTFLIFVFLKICIGMKFYEGSVADRMARLKEGKLLLPDVLR